MACIWEFLIHQNSLEWKLFHFKYKACRAKAYSYTVSQNFNLPLDARVRYFNGGKGEFLLFFLIFTNNLLHSKEKIIQRWGEKDKYWKISTMQTILSLYCEACLSHRCFKILRIRQDYPYEFLVLFFTTALKILLYCWWKKMVSNQIL